MKKSNIQKIRERNQTEKQREDSFLPKISQNYILLYTNKKKRKWLFKNQINPPKCQLSTNSNRCQLSVTNFQQLVIQLNPKVKKKVYDTLSFDKDIYKNAIVLFKCFVSLSICLFLFAHLTFCAGLVCVYIYIYIYIFPYIYFQNFGIYI